jgi:DNA-binding response OmpR family regulator
VIDDDPRVKEALSAMIEREGWSFYGADNVEEAVAAVNDIQPEVIVLEPRADHGKAAAMLIDVHQAGAWIPVVLYTSDSTINDLWALEHGASGLLRKPLGEALLRERIGELLNRRGDRSPAPDDLRLPSLPDSDGPQFRRRREPARNLPELAGRGRGQTNRRAPLPPA